LGSATLSLAACGTRAESFIRPGKPIENAQAESSIVSSKDGWLNENWFLSVREAMEIIES